MSIMGGVIIYVNLWMVILFMVLPFGIKNQVDSANYQKGTDPGAVSYTHLTLPTKA